MLDINYGKAQLLAWDVLAQYSNGVLPVNLNYIIDNVFDLGVKTYSEWSKDLLAENPVALSWAESQMDLIDALGTKESILLSSGIEHMILYNDLYPHTKCRFNIAHEIGHYFMCHKKGDYQTYTEVQEREANYFARQLLTPFPLIRDLVMLDDNNRHDYVLCSYFEVSTSVMNYTINNMNKLFYIPKNQELTDKFHDSILTLKAPQLIS